MWDRINGLKLCLDSTYLRYGLGTLKFRGWVPRNIPLESTSQLTDVDFKPNFEQKGVDMRIGPRHG